MKKIFLLMAVGAMAIMSACSGNKSEAKTDTEAEATVQTEEQTNTTKLDAAQRQALVNAGLVAEADFAKPVFVDFNATWCGPCRQFTPYFEAAAEKFADKAKFVPVDVDVYGEVAGAFGVQSIPMVLAILPSGEYVTYIGTQDIVGDGVFDAIVEGFTK